MNTTLVRQAARPFQRMSLFQRFMLGSLLIMIAGALALGAWVGSQIRTGVINRSGATTALYVDSFITPLLQELGTEPQLSAANAAALSNLLNSTSLGRQIVAFKVWDLDGRVVFSTDEAAVGTIFPMHSVLIEASQGRVATRVSVEDVENAPQRAIHTEVLEIYSPVRRAGTNQVIAIAEYYQTVDDLRGEIAAAQQRSWLVVAVVMALVYLLLSGFVRSASRTISSQQQALNSQIDQLQGLLEQNEVLTERVRRAAGRVSTVNERLLRRVGAELHDGPAQDLGLALLQMDVAIGKLESQPAAEPQVQQLNQIQALLKNTLGEMRAIAAGLGLPQLAALNLEETVARVIQAHERRTGTKVDLEIGTGRLAASLPTKIALYRILQEALNNAHHHAGGAGQAVRVWQEGGQVFASIHDQGPGFSPGELVQEDGHLGLTGMRDRVESLGGSFRLESEGGRGTAIFVQLPLRAEGETND